MSGTPAHGLDLGAIWQRRRVALYRASLYLLLILGASFMLLPFYWMVTTSFKDLGEALRMPPTWIPHAFRWENWVNAWESAPFGRYFFNSFFVAILCVIGEVLTTILAAYAFARLNFLGKEVVWWLLMLTIMIPGEMLLIPNYITLARFGWINTYWALIIPWIVSVYWIFFLRQAFMTFPRDLWDTAQLDGCGRWRFLWKILVPNFKAAIAAVALIKFIFSWNAFLWVLIVTNSERVRTVPVGLSIFSSEAGIYYNELMAASTMAILPIVLLFIFSQRWIIQGVMRTGMKF
jgi:multiple sugar transport system permease protein